MPAPLNLDAMYLYWNNRDERPYARIARVGTDPLPEVEITEEVYDYALNVLPPGYLPGGGFYVIERITGDVVSAYFRRGDRFFHRYLELAPAEAAEDDDSYPGPCTDPEGHVWPRVEEHERCLCIHCGADGDA